MLRKSIQTKKIEKDTGFKINQPKYQEGGNKKEPRMEKKT